MDSGYGYSYFAAVMSTVKWANQM